MRCGRCGHVSDGCTHCDVNDDRLTGAIADVRYCTNGSRGGCYRLELADRALGDPFAGSGDLYKVPWDLWENAQTLLADLEDLYRARNALWLSQDDPDASEEVHEAGTRQWEWLVALDSACAELRALGRGSEEGQ